MKKTGIIFAVSIIVLWGMVADAAFKWSADLNQMYAYRIYNDLNNDNNNAVGTRGDIGGNINQKLGQNSGDDEHIFNTLLGVNASWEMVKDTAFTFRVVSQFDWLGTNTSGPRQTSVPGQAVGTNASTGTDALGLSVNQAFLTLNDFNGFPVNFKFGRQNIMLGKGFVMGNRLFGAGPTIYANGVAPTGSNSSDGLNGQDISGTMGNLPLNAIVNGSISMPEISDFKGFDAITFNVHLMPGSPYRLNIDGGFAIVADAFVESQPGDDSVSVIRNVGSDDNETLTFLNVGFKEKKFNAETYFLWNNDPEGAGDQDTEEDSTNSSAITTDRVYTAGVRGDVDLLEDWSVFKKLNVFAEGAYQWGQLGTDTEEAPSMRKRHANAFNFGVDSWLTTAMSPWFGTEFAYFSGMDNKDTELPDDTVGDGNLRSEDWKVWDPQFRGRFFTKIADFLDSVYLTDQMEEGTVGSNIAVKGRLDAGFTNRWLALVKGGFEPMKKTTLGLTVAYINAVMPPQAGRSKAMGAEVDWDLGYEFSSVVNWYFDGGVFLPGAYYVMPDPIGSGNSGPENAYLFRTGFKVNLG